MIDDDTLTDLGFKWAKDDAPDIGYWTLRGERGEIRYGKSLGTGAKYDTPRLWIWSGLGGESYVYDIQDPTEEQIQQIIDALT